MNDIFRRLLCELPGVSKHIKKDVNEVVELFGEWFIKVQIKEWNMNVSFYFQH